MSFHWLLFTRPHLTSTEVFNDHFLDKLFDLVEQTRSMHDETFNYSVIKLIVRLMFGFQYLFPSDGVDYRLRLMSNLWLQSFLPSRSIIITYQMPHILTIACCMCSSAGMVPVKLSARTSSLC